MTAVWKLRQKSTGLYWDGAWVPCPRGMFEEFAVNVEGDTELVRLLMIPFKVGDRVRFRKDKGPSGLRPEFFGLPGTVTYVREDHVGVMLDEMYRVGKLSTTTANGWTASKDAIEHLDDLPSERVSPILAAEAKRERKRKARLERDTP